MFVQSEQPVEVEGTGIDLGLYTAGYDIGYITLFCNDEEEQECMNIELPYLGEGVYILSEPVNEENHQRNLRLLHSFFLDPARIKPGNYILSIPITKNDEGMDSLYIKIKILPPRV